MPQRFAQQIVIALALVALSSGVAWADKFQRNPPQRNVPQRSVPPRNEPQRNDSQRNEQPRNDPQLIDPQRNGPPGNDWQTNESRDGGLPASVRRVQRETGGQVLKAQPIERDGRQMYRVKVLTPQGRIRVVEDVPPFPRSDPSSSNPPNDRHPE